MFSLPRQVWFSPGCRAACVRKSIRPLVLISPTYITLQINDTIQEGRSIGDKVKVSPLPVHGAQGWDGGGDGDSDRGQTKLNGFVLFVFHPQMSLNNHGRGRTGVGKKMKKWIWSVSVSACKDVLGGLHVLPMGGGRNNCHWDIFSCNTGVLSVSFPYSRHLFCFMAFKPELQPIIKHIESNIHLWWTADTSDLKDKIFHKLSYCQQISLKRQN